MKKNKHIKSFLFLAFVVISWSNCIGQNNNLKDGISKENKHLINTMFDSIAYESLDLVMKDRVFVNKPDAILELRNVTLDSISSKLQKFGRTDQNIDSLYNYTERFIKLRNQYLESRFQANNQLKDSLDKILTTNLIIKSIIKHKEKEKPYIDLIAKIKKHIKHTADHLKGIEAIDNKLKQDFPEHLPNKVSDEEKTEKSNSGFWSLLKKNSILFFIALMVSILLNISLLYLLFKKKRKIKKKKNHVFDSNLLTLSKENEVLSSKKAEALIIKEYEKWISTLEQKFGTACISSLSDKIKVFKIKLIQETTSTSFSSLEKLQKFMNQNIETHATELIEILKKCNDKNRAEDKVGQAIDGKQFLSDYISTEITQEEINIVVDRFKRNLINELPSTISDTNLSNEILDTKYHIKQAINEIIKNNLKFYFPFTNDKGELLDDKKSKNKERDSALCLIIDSHDSSKATFRLLYEYSDMMQAGIQSYDIFLLPICNLTSDNFNRTGSEIQQIGEDGQMRLEGNRWKVVKKITIKII